MIPENLKEDLERVRMADPSLGDLLKASAYDRDCNLSGSLSVELFKHSFLVDSDPSWKRLAEEFERMLLNRVGRKDAIILAGYAGNGKTTFIRNFIASQPQFQHFYYDIHERQHMDGDSIAEIDDNVLGLIRYYIKNDDLDTRNTFSFMSTHANELRDEGFISNDLFIHLEKTRNHLIDDVFIGECSKAFRYRDNFTCLFLHLFLNTVGNSKRIVYFDNLDAVSLEYLSKQFFENFIGAFQLIKRLATSGSLKDLKIFVERDYRFVFCLRDANFATINTHHKGRLSVERMDFVIDFDADFYKSIANKRLTFAIEDYLPPGDAEHEWKDEVRSMSRILEGIVGEDYFRRAIVPLYNFDYRGIVRTLTNHKLPQSIALSKFSIKFGYLGIAVHVAVDDMLRNDFLADYRKIEVPDSDEGYCYIDRMLLTVILNRTVAALDSGRIDMAQSTSLLVILKDLVGIYEPDEIISAIIRCFMYHSESHVHLLTIYGAEISPKNKRDIASKWSLLWKQTENDGDNAARDVLDRIKLRINPSGFAYLRHILIHFEFYSLLAENKAPLFLCDYRKGEPNPCKEFEAILDKTLRLVQYHHKNMTLFFRKRFLDRKVFNNSEEFNSSIYCFKYTKDRGTANKQGLFHSTRIATSHIGYIDRFRIELLKKYADTEDVVAINRSLLARISKYVEMIRNSDDSLKGAGFALDFGKALAAIEDTQFRNTTIEINTKGHS